jgi:hypothetical protein
LFPLGRYLDEAEVKMGLTLVLTVWWHAKALQGTYRLDPPHYGMAADWLGYQTHTLEATSYSSVLRTLDYSTVLIKRSLSS